MDEARFNPTPGSSTGGDTGFDYFGAAPTVPAPGASTYGQPASVPTGGAPAGPPAFGAPGQSPFGGPMTYAAPPPAKASRRGFSGGVRALAVIVVLLIGIGGFRVYEQHQRNRPLVLPASFNGQDVYADAQAQSIMGSALKNFRTENPSIASNAQIYGSGKVFTVLLAARGQIDVKKDLSGNGLGPAQALGDTWCAAALDQSFDACERTGSDLTVLVLTAGATIEATSSLVDPAYAGF